MNIHFINHWKHWKHWRTIHNLITISYIKLHNSYYEKHMLYFTLLNFSIHISFKTKHFK